MEIRRLHADGLINSLREYDDLDEQILDDARMLWEAEAMRAPAQQ